MKQPATAYTIFVVDGSRVMSGFIEKHLQHIGFQTASANSADDALHWLRTHRADVILLDASVPDNSGFAVATLLAEATGDVPIPCIVLPKSGDEAQGADMVRQGASGYLTKDGMFFKLLQARVLEAIDEVESEDVLAESTAAIRDSEERLRAIVDLAVYGIITIDAKGIVESFNKAAERIFGYAPIEVLGQNISMLMPDPYKHEHDGYLDRYMKTGEAKIIGIGREVVGQRKDGTTFPMSLAVSEVRLKGRMLFTGIIHDLGVLLKNETAIQ